MIKRLWRSLKWLLDAETAIAVTILSVAVAIVVVAAVLVATPGA